MPASLPNLPNELIEWVLLQLPPLEILPCRQINKFFHELIDSSLELRICIKLALNGWTLHDRGNESASVLLQRIESMSQSLSKFQFTSQWSFTSLDTEENHFEVADGQLALSQRMLAMDRFRGISCQDLIHPDKPHHRTDRDDLGFTYVDFTFCAAADLVVFIEHGLGSSVENIRARLHFRTLSTNEKHPLATKPHIDVHVATHWAWDSCDLQLCEEHVALVLHDPHLTLPLAQAWNWHTGEVVMPAYGVLGASFISRDYFLLLIDLSLFLFSVRKRSFIRRLQLPFSSQADSMLLVAHPFHGSHNGNQYIGDQRWLTLDPSLNTFGIWFTYDRETSFMVFSTEGILRQLDNLHGNPVPWDEWGPSTSRWLLPNSIIRTSIRSIFGSRILGFTWLNMLTGTPDGGPDYTVILDFNPRPIRKSNRQVEEPIVFEDDHVRVLEIGKPSIYSRGYTGNMEVETRLPFRATIYKKRALFANAYLDALSVIGRDRHSYHVYSFRHDHAPGPEDE